MRRNEKVFVMPLSIFKTSMFHLKCTIQRTGSDDRRTNNFLLLITERIHAECETAVNMRGISATHFFHSELRIVDCREAKQGWKKGIQLTSSIWCTCHRQIESNKSFSNSISREFKPSVGTGARFAFKLVTLLDGAIDWE